METKLGMLLLLACAIVCFGVISLSLHIYVIGSMDVSVRVISGVYHPRTVDYLFNHSLSTDKPFVGHVKHDSIDLKDHKVILDYSSVFPGEIKSHEFHHEVSNKVIQGRCQKSIVKKVKNAYIGPCQSIVTNSTIFAWFDILLEPNDGVSKKWKCYKEWKEMMDNPDKEYTGKVFNQYWKPKSKITEIRVKKLIPVLYSYGHIFAHVLKDILPQVAVLRSFLVENPDAYILVKPFSRHTKHTSAIWERLGIPKSRVLYTKGEMSSVSYIYYADELIYHQCYPGPQATGVLPSSFYRMLKRYLVQDMPDIDIQDRKLIIWPSRKPGTRRITNEDEIIKELKSTFGKMGFTVIKFSGSNETFENSITMFRNARIVVGPHGGGMYNSISSGKRTAVLEVSPDSYGEDEVHRLSYKLGNLHYGLIKKGMGRNDPFGEVDPKIFITLILAALKCQKNANCHEIKIDYRKVMPWKKHLTGTHDHFKW